MSDLISRSALVKDIKDRQKVFWDCESIDDEYCNILFIVDRQPTVKARKVVHGEWIDDTGCLDSVRQYKCSNCGSKPITNFAYNTILSNFCPNCGADMRKVE